jgi:hypothetical protein
MAEDGHLLSDVLTRGCKHKSDSEKKPAGKTRKWLCPEVLSIQCIFCRNPLHIPDYTECDSEDMSEKVQKLTFVINNAIELTNQDTEGDTR